MSAEAIELPLFPLDAVLFPGTVLPLHIFEPRYRRMVVDCQSENIPFGVVLARPESEHLREVPYRVGTMALIRDLDELEDGRYNVTTIGAQRFRITGQHREKPYLSGVVEPFEDDVQSGEILFDVAKQARRLLGSYLELLLDVTNERDIEENLPDTPEALSHLIAHLLDIKNEQKQRYLEMTSTQQRLQEEISILRREVPFMRQFLLKTLPDDQARLN